MKIEHNKLVRDHIPDIIKKANKYPSISILEDDEYLHHLKLKLIEEANEVLNTDNTLSLTEELADVLEVLEALCHTTHISYEDILVVKEKKAYKNGKFDKKILLEYVEDDHE